MNNDKRGRDQRALMEGLNWWGVPTLFRCPLAALPDECDIALIGVPHSSGNGTTERDQHFGPRAVRDVSASARRVHLQFGFSPWEACRIRDLGDVPLPEANDNEKSVARIAEFYRVVGGGGARPVSIGGDHSVTGGILSGIAGANAPLTGDEPAALLQFDAHTDTFHNLDHFLGAKKSAAHWASYLVAEGRVDPARSVQIGVRGNPRTLDWLDTSRELGYQIITKDEHDDIGWQKCANMIDARVGAAPLYITFDLDCLDPSAAPAVSNLEAGTTGFTVSEAARLLRSVRGKNVIGGDVVCLMPTKDSPNKITAQVAAAMMFEIIALIADNHQNGRATTNHRARRPKRKQTRSRRAQGKTEAD